MNPRPVLLSRRIIDINIYITQMRDYGIHTSAESNRILYSSASDTLKRMSDSQIENISKKFKNIIALKFWNLIGTHTQVVLQQLRNYTGSFWMSIWHK